MLKRLLTHPLTRGLDIDSPQTSQLRRRIIQEKKFLCRLYQDWYRSLADSLPTGSGDVLELGSGGGFLRDYVPGLVTSDVLPLADVQLVVDATRRLPFRSGDLRGIVMTNVLHHVADCRAFFAEAARCLRPGGVLAMIEPWVSSWSRLVYARLHHEPFRPDAGAWEFPAAGPLSSANGALPWLIFGRDRRRFETEFPALRIRQVRPFMPFRYLASGGVAMRSLMPGWSYRLWSALETGLAPLGRWLAMFAHIVVERVAVNTPRAIAS